jgi:NAD-dependent deacetylase
MYLSHPDEFLLWYYQRFASYRHVKPNLVHLWLSDKNLITQNIDGLDGKAGNQSYIPIHGRLDKVTFLHDQGTPVPIEDAPWDEIAKTCPDNDETLLKAALLDAFRISPKTLRPEPMVSLKPFVLLFDEYYTDLYRISEAEQRMQAAECFVFMGTSFSVNITNIALNHALRSGAAIHVVDPEPVDIGIPGIVYHAMKAQDYIAQ